MFKRATYILVALLAGVVLGGIVQPFRALESSAQAGCQTFKETGKTVCGAFLTYWTNHGGLAQQGLPLSGEFSEVSPLNGKTYTVQYFERAVFEKHPENAAPYDVLLSQLGTFQFKAKYPGGDPSLNGTPVPQPTPPPSSGTQTFTGHGAQTTNFIALSAGLARFHLVATDAQGGAFSVWLLDSKGNHVDLLVNVIGATDTTKAINIASAGNYLLQVENYRGDWTITIQQ